MPNQHEQDQPTQYESTAASAGRRGRDDRRTAVDPASNPAPRSPAPDERVIREGEETLERVKAY